MSRSLMYSKPASISSVSSFSLWATLHVKLSVVCSHRACSRFMYICVQDTSLCPSMVLTCIMSFVLWYSVVAFQCRKVWNVIFVSLGLLSLWARSLRCVE